MPWTTTSLGHLPHLSIMCPSGFTWQRPRARAKCSDCGSEASFANEDVRESPSPRPRSVESNTHHISVYSDIYFVVLFIATSQTWRCYNSTPHVAQLSTLSQCPDDNSTSNLGDHDGDFLSLL